MQDLLVSILTEEKVSQRHTFCVGILLTGVFVFGIIVAYHTYMKHRNSSRKEWIIKLTIPKEKMDKIDFDTVLEPHVLSKELLMIKTMEKWENCEYYYRLVLKSKKVEALLVNIVRTMNCVLEVQCVEENSVDYGETGY